MRRLQILFMIFGIILMQCAKKAIIRKYYLIEIPADAQIIQADSTYYPYRVDVRDFQISKAIDQTHIALLSDTQELSYYFYHNWAVRPSTGIPDMIYHVLSKKSIFTSLVRGFSSHPDYQITGDVYHLERDEIGQIRARIAADIKLIDMQTGDTKAFHSFDRTDAFQNPKSMNAFAVAVSQILYQEITVFTDSLASYFSNLEAK